MVFPQRILWILCLLMTLATAANVAYGNYWSGGVGEEERLNVPDGNTLIIFSQRSGPYLANMAFTIRRSDGDVQLQGKADGPWVITDLPSGDYFVTATRANGDRQGLAFSVREGKQARAILSFP